MSYIKKNYFGNLGRQRRGKEKIQLFFFLNTAIYKNWLLLLFNNGALSSKIRNIVWRRVIGNAFFGLHYISEAMLLSKIGI